MDLKEFKHVDVFPTRIHVAENFLDKEEFEKVKEWKYPILENAASNFYYDKAKSTKYKQFCIQNSFWLDDYAAFKIIKKLQGNSSWKDWKTNYRHD